MRRHRKPTVRAALAALVVAAATSMVAGAASMAPAGAKTVPAHPGPTPEWHPCPENAQVECATVRVPVDWDEPGDDTIDSHNDGNHIGIAIARRKATDPAHRIGSLISMPGGPGTSGVDQITGRSPFSPELAARFDIVSFDPRGVGRSHPVRCGADLVANPPNTVPDNGGRLSEVRSYSRALAASCRHYTGPLFDHMDSTSAAHDLDAIRAVLGEDKITLYGRSYGTLLGQLYAEAFPSRVRALLLDSVDDHSLDGSRFLVTESRTAEDAFTEFTKWCDRDTTCTLHGQDVGDVYDGLWDRASRGELHNPADQAAPLRPMNLSTLTIQHFYGPDWPQLADQLQQLVHQQPAGTGETAAPPQRGKSVPFPGVIVCSDWRFDIHSTRQWAAQWRAQNQAAPRLRSSFAWTAGSLCSQWPGSVPNPQHPAHIGATPPILIMNGLHDPATAYEWAIGVAHQITGSTLLTYDGWGHGVYPRSACTTGVADRYLIDLSVPAPGTHCPPA